MMNGKNQKQTTAPERRRGRPTGQNRVPLSLEEKRARNAFYERERRNATADAMSELAEAIGGDTNMSNADVMATAIYKLQTRADERSINDLQRINGNLESQIAMLQARLGLDDESVDRLEFEDIPPITFPSSSNGHQIDERQTAKKLKRKRNKSDRRLRDGGKRVRTASSSDTASGHATLNSEPRYTHTNTSVPHQTHTHTTAPHETHTHTTAPHHTDCDTHTVLGLLTENEKQLITGWLEEEGYRL